MASHQEAAGHCRKCGDVLVKRPGTRHVLHLLLSIVTMGFWIPIWLLCSIKIGGWRCSQCGKRASRRLLG
jgi:ssDNA-binding Zn-finger/Zn-ribbon topoisomerase 1